MRFQSSSAWYGVNAFDSDLESSTYCYRLEKWNDRGFSIALPGCVPDKVSRRFRDASYFSLPGPAVVLLRAEKQNISSLQLVVGGRQARVKEAVAERCRVLTKFERIAAKHFGRVSRIDDAQEKCFPIVLRTSAMIIWGLPSKAQVVEEEQDSSEYSTTPMESVQSLLKEVSKRNANDSEQASEFQWWLGGAFRQSSNKPVFRALCQVDADVYQRIDSRVSLHFVYDLVAAATSFNDLKFVLDAGRCPLRDIPSDVFKETYGIKKELSFKRAEKREAKPTDLWSVLY